MAYTPDETNNFGLIAKRGFAHEGLGYAAGEWFYGTREQVEALYRVGVFGFDYPLWMVDALPLGTHGQTEGLEPRVSWLQYGDIWGAGYRNQTLPGSRNELYGRELNYGFPSANRPYNWWMVFNEQHHVIA